MFSKRYHLPPSLTRPSSFPSTSYHILGVYQEALDRHRIQINSQAEAHSGVLENLKGADGEEVPRQAVPIRDAYTVLHPLLVALSDDRAAQDEYLGAMNLNDLGNCKMRKMLE